MATIHTAVVLDEGTGEYYGVSVAKDEAGVIAALRRNYDAEGDLDGTPDEDLIEALEGHQGLIIHIEQHGI